jgi:competence protein ComEC
MESESALEQLTRENRPLLVHLTTATARPIGQLLVVALLLWLVSLPIVMSEFHLFTPIAVILAPLVGVISWVALTSGLALLVVSWSLPFAGGILQDVCGMSIGMLRGAISIAEEIPGGHLWVAGPPTWWTLGAYGGAATLLFAGRRMPTRWKIAVLSIWVAIGLGSSAMPPRTGDSLQCTFLSVGHGTCVVLRTPDGECYLYDAGSLGSPELAAESIAACLWEEGISRLDGVILSHADIDHFNAMPRLLQRFSVDGVFVSPVMFNTLMHPDVGSAPRQFQKELAEAGLATREIFGNDRLHLGGGVTATILHPPQRPMLGASDNAYSLVILLEYAGRRVLLTGDLESPGMEDVIAEAPVDVDVLLAPHHGSRFSDPPGLAKWCRPEWVVISGGGESGSAEAAQTYRDGGSEVFNTSTDAAVGFTISRDKVALRHWSNGAWKSLRGRE